MQTDLENLTKKWWFYVTFFLVVMFIQPLVKPIDFAEMGVILREALVPYGWLAPIFHVATIIFVILLWKYDGKIGRYFYAYLGGNYIFSALAQNITVLEEHGFVIVISNLILILFVGVFFVWAVFRYEKSFEPQELKLWRFWAIPFAILAFWGPMNEFAQPHFDPILLLTSGYGLAFCFTTPVTIFILTLYHPGIYKPAYRFLCVVGLYFGFINIIGPLTIPEYTVWLAFLHVPLFTISIYGLILEKIAGQKRIANN